MYRDIRGVIYVVVYNCGVVNKDCLYHDSGVVYLLYQSVMDYLYGNVCNTIDRGKHINTLPIGCCHIA